MKKHKEKTKGLGIEGIIIFLDYYSSLNKKSAFTEIIFPVIISLICTIVYTWKNLASSALIKLADILPSAISILIGFTAMMVTLLITSDSERIEILKNIETKETIRGKKASLYQKIFVQSCHSLFNEILLLLIIFLYLFLYGLGVLNSICLFVFLLIEIYFVINILVSIFSNITSIYFSFYSNKIE